MLKRPLAYIFRLVSPEIGHSRLECIHFEDLYAIFKRVKNKHWTRKQKLPVFRMTKLYLSKSITLIFILTKM